jgi:hypothetical protein
VGYHGFTGVCHSAVPEAILQLGFSNYTTGITSLYYDMLPPPLRLDPTCYMNLGLSLSGGE